MNKYKFTYMWWCSVCKDEKIIYAENEEEAYKKFNVGFGYEDVDIISCEQIDYENYTYTDIEQSKKLAKILPILKKNNLTMEVFKNCTDLEQSKKLTEFLPLESADMVIWGKDLDAIAATDAQKLMKGLKDRKMNYIPCWSLSALLDVIPQEIFCGDYVINITGGHINKWALTYDHYENRHHSYFGLSTGADNLVDACYEFILKLHEQNLL